MIFDSKRWQACSDNSATCLSLIYYLNGLVKIESESVPDAASGMPLSLSCTSAVSGVEIFIFVLPIRTRSFDSLKSHTICASREGPSTSLRSPQTGWRYGLAHWDHF